MILKFLCLDTKIKYPRKAYKNKNNTEIIFWNKHWNKNAENWSTVNTKHMSFLSFSYTQKFFCSPWLPELTMFSSLAKTPVNILRWQTFASIISDSQLLTIFAKLYILDVYRGPCYASDFLSYFAQRYSLWRNIFTFKGDSNLTHFWRLFPFFIPYIDQSFWYFQGGYKIRTFPRNELKQ